MVKRKNASTTETFYHAPTNASVVLAPHAGEIEPGTGRQAEIVARACGGWSAWSYAAEADEGSVFDTYHTRSIHIDKSEYMYLTEVIEHPFERAVAFHGFAPETNDVDIYIGGQLSWSRREELAQHISEMTGFDTIPARPGDGLWKDYGGKHNKNLVNRIIQDNNGISVQLEQRREPRRESPEAIAHAVINYIERSH